MNPALISVAIAEVPNIIELLKAAFGRARPGAPVPTDAEVIAAYNVAFIASLSVDTEWLKAHPT